MRIFGALLLAACAVIITNCGVIVAKCAAIVANYERANEISVLIRVQPHFARTQSHLPSFLAD